MARIEIVWTDGRVLVAKKPHFLPCAPLGAGDDFNFLSQVAEVEPRVLAPKGKLEREGGLLHRLDTPTSGLVLFALDQEAYDDLMAQQKADLIIKQYRARWGGPSEVPEAFPEYGLHDPATEPGMIHSYFRPYGPKGASVRPCLDPDAKRCSGVLYVTETEPEGPDSVICTITRGFRHQIRAHMAWAGRPLLGDTRYGGPDSDTFGLEAIGLSFRSPADGTPVTITI